MRSFILRMISAAAVATPVTFGALAFPASPAHAAAAASATTCKVLKGTSAASTATLGGCTKRTTGGAGTISGIGPNTDVVTWKNTGTTTFTYTHVRLANSACPKKSDEYQWTGTVTASTGPASGVTGKVAALICVTTNSTAKAHLLKGTLWTF